MDPRGGKRPQDSVLAGPCLPFTSLGPSGNRCDQIKISKALRTKSWGPSTTVPSEELSSEGLGDAPKDFHLGGTFSTSLDYQRGSGVSKEKH